MIEIISERRYGQPKLDKPKELKNVRQAFTYELNRHCKCPVFIVGDDVYIKHRDWFSTDVYHGKKYEEWKSKNNKFVYNDKWGAVVLRGECWLRLRNVLDCECIVPTLQKLALECIEDDSKFNSDDERMINDVVTKCWKVRNGL